MSWPTDTCTTTHLDASTDDPSQARAEIKTAVDAVKAVIAGRGTASGVCELDASSLIPSTRINSALVTGALGYTPIQQGTGSGQTTGSTVKIGKSSSAAKLKAEVGGTDYGSIALESWAMPVAGGTMTGPLTVSGNVVATSGYGDTITLGGDNAGSDIEFKVSGITRPINVYSAAGNVTFGVTGTLTATAGLNIDSGVLYVDAATNRVGINDTTPSYSLDVTGTVNATGAVTFGSSLTTASTITVDSASGNATLTLDKASATDYALIQGYNSGERRWAIALGENTDEGTGNAGSNFKIFGYNDDGDYLNTPLTITRSTGDAAFSQAVTAGTYFVAGEGYGLRFGDGSARIYGSGSADTISFYVDSTEYYRMSTSAFRPGTNSDGTGGIDLGASSYRWKQIYAYYTTISSSDAREKTPVRELSPAELRAATRLAGAVGCYQWLAAIRARGEASALVHCGTTAQQVEAILREEGLDPMHYAMIDHDPVGDHYGLRYEEVSLFIARGLDARLRALESLMGDR